MSHNTSTISSPELLALYKELTDFKEIDSASVLRVQNMVTTMLIVILKQM
ncbi:hypothetical protein ACPV5G_00840 [Photobacterium damselae]